MSETLEVVWSGDTHGPARGYLNVHAHPILMRPSALPDLSAYFPPMNTRGPWREKTALVIARLKAGPATHADLMQAGHCKDDLVYTLLKRLRRAGTLRSTRTRLTFGRGRWNYWLD